MGQRVRLVRRSRRGWRDAGGVQRARRNAETSGRGRVSARPSSGPASRPVSGRFMGGRRLSSRPTSANTQASELPVEEGLVLFGGFNGHEVLGDVVEMEPESLLSDTAVRSRHKRTDRGTHHDLKLPAPRFAHAAVAISDPGERFGVDLTVSEERGEGGGEGGSVAMAKGGAGHARSFARDDDGHVRGSERGGRPKGPNRVEILNSRGRERAARRCRRGRYSSEPLVVSGTLWCQTLSGGSCCRFG